MRIRRAPSTWWNTTLTAADLDLRPITTGDAYDWLRLVDSTGATPPAAGLSASPLGGVTSGAGSWRSRCLQLRGAARRGTTYPYLVRRDGAVIGEAFAFFDAGTAAAGIVVWLNPVAHTPKRHVACVLLLARHLLAAPDRPGRAIVHVEVEDREIVAALLAEGFVQEGVLRDPPRSDRAVLVTHSSCVEAIGNTVARPVAGS